MTIFKRIFGVVVAMAIATPTFADDVKYPGPYQADVLNVYDGDTITALVHMWPDISIEVGIRLADIDTPEIRGRCKAEEEAAIQARNFVVNMVENSNNRIWVRNIETGKYAGRVIGNVLTETGEDIGESLLSYGLAVPYEERAAQRDRLCPEG